jgi:hypothetical protein
MKPVPRSRQHHDFYRKYNGQDSEISGLLGECRLGPVSNRREGLDLRVRPMSGQSPVEIIRSASTPSRCVLA